MQGNCTLTQAATERCNPSLRAELPKTCMPSSCTSASSWASVALQKALCFLTKLGSNCDCSEKQLQESNCLELGSPCQLRIIESAFKEPAVPKSSYNPASPLSPAYRHIKCLVSPLDQEGQGPFLQALISISDSGCNPATDFSYLSTNQGSSRPVKWRQKWMQIKTKTGEEIKICSALHYQLQQHLRWGDGNHVMGVPPAVWTATAAPAAEQIYLQQLGCNEDILEQQHASCPGLKWEGFFPRLYPSLKEKKRVPTPEEVHWYTYRDLYMEFIWNNCTAF